MIPTFLLGLLGIGIPKWLEGPLKWLVDAGIIIALLGGAYLWIYHSGKAAGGAAVTRAVEVQHAARVEEARHDERSAQSTVNQIGATTARTNQAVNDLVQSKIEEMHHAIDSVPAAPAGDPPAGVDTGSVSASLNALIAGANRSADAADAQP